MNTIKGQSKKKITLIGCGRRIKRTIIPALLELAHLVEIQSVSTRSKLSPEDVRFLDSCDLNHTYLGDINLQSTDILYIGIPAFALSSVLKQLSKKVGLLTRNITLVIDTPFPIGKNTFDLSRSLKLFKRVCVLEDCIYLLPYSISFSCGNSYSLGSPAFAAFIHSGFTYHAYSQIKEFHKIVGFDFVRRHNGKSKFSQQLLFKNGKHIASIIEPRDYRHGMFSFWYKNGTFSDYIKGEETEGFADILCMPIVTNSMLEGFDLRCKGRVISRYFFDSPKRIDTVYDKNSIFHACKVEAAKSYLEKILVSEDVVPYSASAAAYDQCVNIMTQRLGFFADIRLPSFKKSVVLMLLETILK